MASYSERPGDFRLLIARRKSGGAVAALYRPVPADGSETPGARRERYFSSAGGEVKLDLPGMQQQKPLPGTIQKKK